MAPVRVVIVDDSTFVRAVLKDLLKSDPDIDVVGEAVNGLDALEKISELKPDLVTMDIEMPEMNGLEAIERIMGGDNALPILVFTSLDDAGTAYDAISRGALELLPKPSMDSFNSDHFARRIKLLSKVKVVRHIRRNAATKENKIKQPDSGSSGQIFPEIVAIASSTGGPSALIGLFAGLTHTLDVPVVVSQHIARGFDDGLMEWLNRETSHARVKIGISGEKILPGTIYLSPANGNMEITSKGIIEISPFAPGDIYTPSCDKLFKSVAGTYGPKSVAVVLTGMGNDGTKGARAVKRAGGRTIAQDEASCVVYGMPKAALESGCIDEVMSLNDIGSCLNGLVKKK
ncbi:two-component system, chemotaxis family, response regulator CheB [Desulfocicer vacuolatum DSM 3385]|uniref:Protein-glutamate methylesterase/protein-glutamine glutaminase n=1 Tax=Desulfocicer vacuolatum DSM 3385 TaxID=1121400 RepID=A0A1W2AK22_9BACT|nr:chemotaxis-specific protein-glutamate methyltransferase CheB [Desulfocicer vacuolatum]SMC61099.1 two-component system, chemotaxis family, response regulator CheB [Desulfocicer vacuolatum DSM 3385]